MSGTAETVYTFSQNPLYSLLSISNIGVLNNLQKKKKKEQNRRGLNPQANCTYRATAACQ
jgi:hypothetical protein